MLQASPSTHSSDPSGITVDNVLQGIKSLLENSNSDPIKVNSFVFQQHCNEIVESFGDRVLIDTNDRAQSVFLWRKDKLDWRNDPDIVQLLEKTSVENPVSVARNRAPEDKRQASDPMSYQLCLALLNVFSKCLTTAMNNVSSTHDASEYNIALDLSAWMSDSDRGAPAIALTDIVEPKLVIDIYYSTATKPLPLPRRRSPNYFKKLQGLEIVVNIDVLEERELCYSSSITGSRDMSFEEFGRCMRHNSLEGYSWVINGGFNAFVGDVMVLVDISRRVNRSEINSYGPVELISNVRSFNERLSEYCSVSQKLPHGFKLEVDAVSLLKEYKEGLKRVAFARYKQSS